MFSMVPSAKILFFFFSLTVEATGMTHSKLEKSSGHGEASIAFDATEYQHLNEENVDAEEPSPSAVDDEGHDSDDLAYALTKPSTRTSKYSSF